MQEGVEPKRLSLQCSGGWQLGSEEQAWGQLGRGRGWDHTDLAASWAPPHAGQPRAHSQPLRAPLGAFAGINEVLAHRAHQLPASACWGPLIVFLCLILLVPLLWFSSIVHQNIALF